MSLREDAIRAYEKEQEKWRADAEARLAAKREEERRKCIEICSKAFGRDPDSVICDEDGIRFIIEDLTFRGHSEGHLYGDSWRLDFGMCPSCESSIWSPYTFPLWNISPEGALAKVGSILEDFERGSIHSCPRVLAVEGPANPAPPRTVTYRHGGVEHNLLDSIREYIDDRIEEEMGDR
jgi:hypothetical protein